MSINLSNVKVEIVLPNYNSAPYLEETINSIINQTFENWKLTIVDGNSNNETQQILRKYINHKKINIIFLNFIHQNNSLNLAYYHNITFFALRYIT